jgi:hypothetical protein
VGRKLDRLIESHFRGRLAIRGIGLVDHPDITLDDLAATILRLGTDRYDPNRAGLYYAREGTDDFCAAPCEVTGDGLKSLRAQHKG